MFRRGASRVIVLPAHVPLEPVLRGATPGGSSLTHVAAELSAWKALCRARRHFGSIAEAMAAARTGDRLLLMPGVFHESVHMHKDVELIGLGAAGDVIIEVRVRRCLLCVWFLFLTRTHTGHHPERAQVRRQHGSCAQYLSFSFLECFLFTKSQREPVLE